MKLTKNPGLILLLFFSFSFLTTAQNKEIKKNKTTEWLIAKLLQDKSNSTKIEGNPKIVPSPFGKAVAFNGIDDALFLNELPVQSVPEFTVEMIFKPEIDAPFEQRILHFGEITKDRMLLEIRAVEKNWYFDGYTCSGPNKKALIDEKLIHPLGQWYHVAFVVTPNSLTTYVNGKMELHEENTFMPIESGITAIGVRQNKVSWFKGSIYKIRITPKVLAANEFTGLIK